MKSHDEKIQLSETDWQEIMSMEWPSRVQSTIEHLFAWRNGGALGLDTFTVNSINNYLKEKKKPYELAGKGSYQFRKITGDS